jgi:D-3-phosphoglycerate dehydrogenase
VTPPLTLELLQWVATRTRTYAEAIEAWRSNCPRDPVWDDAVIAGLVRVVPSRNGTPATVEVTAVGRALLDG